MTQRGPALVRIALFCLFFGAFALGLVQPAQAQEAPAGVLYFTNTLLVDNGAPASGCPSLPVYNMTSALPAAEGQADMGLSLVAQACSTDFQYTATQDFTLGATGAVHVTLDCSTPAPMIALRFDLLRNGEQVSTVQTDFALNACLPSFQAIEFNTTVDTGNTAFVAGDILTIQVIPFWLSPLDSTVQATSAVVVGGANPSAFYAVGLPSTGTPTTGNPNDTDGDGLNDTCEVQYFGNLTAQNATGDPDGDGVSNVQECNGGTDPTKADTDGDGVNDKDDPFPNDATQGGSNTTSSSSSSSASSSSTSSSSSTTRSSGTTTSSSSTSSGAQGSDKVDSFDEAVDRLTSDAGYLGMSAGGFLAVLVLAILALAVRWSL